MDENSNPIAGLAGTLDWDNPNNVILEIPPDQYIMWRVGKKGLHELFPYERRFAIWGPRGSSG
jgi:hypothetical protein